MTSGELKNLSIFAQKNIFLGKESKKLTENIQGLFVDKRNITACYSPAELSFCEAIYAIFIDGLFYHWPMTQERNDAFNQELEDAMAEFEAEKEKPGTRPGFSLFWGDIPGSNR